MGAREKEGTLVRFHTDRLRCAYGSAIICFRECFELGAAEGSSDRYLLQVFSQVASANCNEDLVILCHHVVHGSAII